MDRNAARALLTAVRGGTVDVEAALERLGGVGDLGYARVDLDRARRTGVPEVVFGPGKSPDQIAGVPVIAVPTSVGYGASFGGLAALLAMLNACAAGVSVVNIDNGFGAAYQASLVNHAAAR